MGKWISLIAVVVGMALTMIFAGRIGYWIENKVQAWQLRRRKGENNNS